MKLRVQSAPSQIKTLGFIAAAMLLSVSQSAWALGTASNTPIDNLATLSYSVGGTSQTPIGSSPTGNTAGAGTVTTFKVDNKINLTVAKVDGARVAAVNNQVAATPLPNPPAYLTFTVTNNGNTTQDFILSTTNPAIGQVDPFGGVSTFATSGCISYVESGANSVYNPGVDLPATYIDSLAANGVKNVYVVCNTPLTASNGQTGLAGLVAEAVDAAGTTAVPSVSYTVAQLTAANTQAGIEIVAADIAGTEGDVLRDVKHSARDTYIIATAVLSVAKTVTPICDPFNGATNPKNIPGAAVRYSITIANTGSAAATLAQITDAISASLAFNTDLISGTGAGANCATGVGSLSASGFRAESGAGAGPGLITTANATTAGATKAGAVGAETVTIDFPTLATSAITAPAGATLAAGSFITVYFNAFIQ